MSRKLCVPSLTLVIAGLGGCAALECSPENCATDARITAEVREVFVRYPALGAPGELHVQTINGVVYLNGQVNSDMEMRIARALVMQVPNVKDVVNSLTPRANGR
jgi:osmotically-inducible protein OsmY